MALASVGAARTGTGALYPLGPPTLSHGCPSSSTSPEAELDEAIRQIPGGGSVAAPVRASSTRFESQQTSPRHTLGAPASRSSGGSTASASAPAGVIRTS